MMLNVSTTLVLTFTLIDVDDPAVHGVRTVYGTDPEREEASAAGSR
jgi:hypothetical protein